MKPEKTKEEILDSKRLNISLSMRDYIFEAMEEYKHQSSWVSVKERLPEVEGRYLTYRHNGVVIVEHWYKKDSKFLWGDCYGVKLWMPLPPLPELLSKEETKD